MAPTGREVGRGVAALYTQADPLLMVDKLGEQLVHRERLNAQGNSGHDRVEWFSNPVRMYEIRSSSSSFFPPAAISSARAFILPKYSVIVDVPLDALARAMRVAMTRARDWAAWSPWMAAHAPAAVVSEFT